MSEGREDAPAKSLEGRWEQMHNWKGDLCARSEQYARWTIPSLFLPDSNTNAPSSEAEKSNVAIGARVVHHLSHRIVDTMFPSDKPFFSIQLTPKAMKESKQESEEDQLIVQEALREAENQAMRGMNLTAYRPVAVNALQLNIVTGNALIYRLKNDKRVAYSVRDYCVKRDIAGDLKEVMLRDIKSFGSLDPTMQALVKALAPNSKKYDDNTDCTLYTHFTKEQGKWHQSQAVDTVNLNNETSYNEQDFPCLVLTWALGRGDDYGRGLVEDYSVSFHNVDVLAAAQIDMIGIAADIKFLVNDSSTFDVDAWNNAKRGEYVPGKEGDITVPTFQFAIELQIISQAIDKLERDLAQAFLLSSAGVRDAERVTAEEIRFFAREIEAAFGGLYSRLALEWQKREAEYELAKLSFTLDKDFETQVTTGLETLTREGKLDALRQAIADLSYLDGVPEDIRRAINPLKFMKYVFEMRGVEYGQILYSEEEFRANAEAEQRAQQAQIAAQGEQQVAVNAAKSK